MDGGKKKNSWREKFPLWPDGIQSVFDSLQGRNLDDNRRQWVPAVNNSEGKEMLSQTCVADRLFQFIYLCPLVVDSASLAKKLLLTLYSLCVYVYVSIMSSLSWRYFILGQDRCDRGLFLLPVSGHPRSTVCLIKAATSWAKSQQPAQKTPLLNRQHSPSARFCTRKKRKVFC